ncbi:MAG: aldehyde-activating protein [Gammaproteobacteria bacterium]|nr:MAG: aldehyde-activating protein [Gammaproteobacteria bacterium]PHR85053.1 MAG: aldehyde-activating protein [Colwellia sp.]
MKLKLTGECLCGAVQFSVKNEFKAFYQCHCKQCQQLTGSAFTSNILTAPTNIEWLKGKHNVTVYDHPTRGFSKSFCTVCGSGLPFINKNKTTLIIPAGSLNELPDLKPQANMFTVEEACWLKPGLNAKEFSGFPDQKLLK